jgi:hypothetical protein
MFHTDILVTLARERAALWTSPREDSLCCMMCGRPVIATEIVNQHDSINRSSLSAMRHAANVV